ncbi:DUF861 domain-containing protein [Erwinia sp. S43]|uniref:cupin domain-containing protein n=1 Tax=Erwinia sp. S43 TaxID=2769339 RepID=UPI001909FF30|nr:cupin domain-containing protein [Erwinia sp. S43]MBK0033180.1 DUF861 domain-containing protein [Erwinia sp. S43]
MYPIITYHRDEQRRDIFRSWLDGRPQLDEDLLIERAFYYSKNEQHGVYSGFANLRDFSQQIDAFDADLWLIVIGGRLTLRLSNGDEITANAEDSLVIPRGAQFALRSEAGTRVWFSAYQPEAIADGHSDAQPFKVDADVELGLIDGPAADLISSAERPTVHRRVLYLSADGKFSVGIWQATPYTRRQAAFGDYELMYPVQGEIELSNALGESFVYGPGQGVAVNRGVSNAWHSTGLVKKIYSKISV